MLQTARQTQIGNYAPAPFVLAEGHGCRVKDVDGREYVDLSGGIAVLSLGHCHPTLTRAISEQAERLMHVSNLFYNERAIELSAALCARTPFDKVFFCNSGSEANEAMLKLARRYHYDRGEPKRVEIVSTFKSFHGRTYGSLSCTGQFKYHAGMEPMLPGVRFVDYNDIEALRSAVTEQTAAVIFEPIQAEGGIVVGTDAYLRAAREICSERGALLVMDEIQTGYGRTGRFLASEWAGVVPDACSFAKGMGGGFPLGALAVTEQVARGLPPGSHASTFGGNPLACAAGLAVLSVIDEESLIANAAQQGQHLAQRLAAILSSTASTVDVRGRGLLQGIELASDVDPSGVWSSLHGAGLLASLAGGNTLRVSPALNVQVSELDEGLDIIAKVLSDPPRKSRP